jgi:hypothetical protein
VEAYALDATTAFDESRERFQTILAWLSGPESAGQTHAELEARRLQVASRELFSQLVQDHLDLRAEREPRLAEVSTPTRSHATPSRRGGRARWRRCLATCAWNASPTVPAVTPTCTPLMPC